MNSLGYFNMDCMEGMKAYPDKYFDLAIVDPPYFSGPEKREYYGKRVSSTGVRRSYSKMSSWTVPDKAYFDELMRVSKNQIIWGVNYYDYFFKSGRIVWDKVNDNTSYSDCEIAYCSLHESVRIFRYMWNGMFQGKSVSEGHIQRGNKRLNEVRIHPTQKPVDLYKWLLKEYSKPGNKILDTHVGSASSLIACHDFGLEFIGFEIDKEMYEKSGKRLLDHQAQFRFNLDPSVEDQLAINL